MLTISASISHTNILFFIFLAFFSFILAPLMVSPSNITKYFKFPFLRAFWLFLDLIVLFLLSCVVFGFLLLICYIFLSQISCLYTFCISSVPAFGFPILFHNWQTLCRRPYTLGGWFFFSYDLWTLYPPMHFLSMWLSGIIAITNSNGDITSLWKIPLCIFTSAQHFSPAICSTLFGWLVCLVLWHINFCRLFNAKSIFM